MKALSVDPYYAMKIWFEEKTIEVRTWKTDYRGPVLICSTREKIQGTIPRHALCIAELVDVRPLTRNDCKAAAIPVSAYQKGLYAWVLGKITTVDPFPVRGMPGLFNVDDKLIKKIADPSDDNKKRVEKIWGSITVL